MSSTKKEQRWPYDATQLYLYESDIDGNCYRFQIAWSAVNTRQAAFFNAFGVDNLTGKFFCTTLSTTVVQSAAKG